MQKKSLLDPFLRAHRWIWQAKPHERHLKISQRISRVTLYVVQEVFKGNLQQSALGLSYITLLSLVPLLAVSFSVLKAFGSDQVIEPFLAALLEPLGRSAPELTARISGFVSNIKVGVLGMVGIALLFYTVISLMQKIETVFNGIWRINRLRQLSTRIPMYLSVLLVGPVLVLAATGLTASLLSNQFVTDFTQHSLFSTFIAWVAWLFPLFLWIAVFTFIYAAIPNTQVNFSAALVGGIAAALAWNGVGLAFGVMIAGSTEYTVIYSAFASLILFMVWLQLAWLIVLMGASVSYAWQSTDRLRHFERADLNRQYALMVAALETISLIDASFKEGGTPPSTKTLKNRLVQAPEIDPLLTEQALDLLNAAALIYQVTVDAEGGWLPAKPATLITLAHIRTALWGDLGGDLGGSLGEKSAYHPITQQWLHVEQTAIEPQLSAINLAINHTQPAEPNQSSEEEAAVALPRD
ncbi:MAG: YihY/virulence factor BrkB family protein [Halothiobacillus sp.]